MNAFFFALTFLTRLPSPVKIVYSDKLPSKSLLFYPLIGTIIGLILILLDILFSFFFSNNISNVLLLIALIYLTGGLHLDGFIDTIDGIFSCRKKEIILEIMHDSLVGSFGSIAIMLLLLLKYNLFMEISNPARVPLFILMTSISRYIVLIVIYKYPVAVSSKLGRDFNYNLTSNNLILASIYCLFLCLFLSYFTGFNIFVEIIIILFSYLVIVLFANHVTKKIEGLTGDIYGAIVEISEVMLLISFLITNRFIIS